jgi:hypothetical protein
VPFRQDLTCLSIFFVGRSVARVILHTSCVYILVLVSSDAKGGLRNFGGPKTGRPGRFDPATYLCGYCCRYPPCKKNAPHGPARGKGQHGTAGGTVAWPAALPRPPHLVAGPPKCPPRPGRRKNGPGRPLGSPAKTKILTRKPPIGVTYFCLPISNLSIMHTSQ